MATVELRGVTKTYAGGVRAVEDVSLTVADGELLVLVGPSGSGKTTLLRIIAGLERPTRGQVCIGGRVVTGVPPHKRQVSMVFQHPALYPHLTVRGNLAFPLRMRRVGRGQRERRVAEVAEMLGLSELLHRRPHELSGGQRQRVAIGRALVRRPAVCLMDEPLSHLDPPLRNDIRTEILGVHRRLRTTIVYVTHDQAEAMAIGERMAVIREGRLQQVGTGQQLYDEPRNVFVARFLGSPGMNVWPAELHRDQHGRWAVRWDDHTLHLPEKWPSEALESLAGRPLLVGLRPEAMAVDSHASAGRSIRARVQAVERLGHEMVLYLDPPSCRALAGQVARAAGWDEARPPPLAARLPAAGPAPRPGEVLIFRADASRMMLFDKQGNAILSGPGGNVSACRDGIAGAKRAGLPDAG